MLRLSFMFLVGSLMYLFRDRVPMNPQLGLAAGFVFVLSLVFASNYRPFGGVALVFVLLWLSIAIPLRIGSTHDISYGVYIYAFPIQQILAIVGWNRIGWVGYAVVSLVLTVPLAGQVGY